MPLHQNMSLTGSFCINNILYPSQHPPPPPTLSTPIVNSREPPLSQYPNHVVCFDSFSVTETFLQKSGSVNLLVPVYCN